jgi:hypothetical protein
MLHAILHQSDFLFYIKKLYIQFFSMIQGYFGFSISKIQRLLGLGAVQTPRGYWGLSSTQQSTQAIHV